MKKIKIPNTDSIKELAKFFETHDSTDFEDELVEVSEPVFLPRNAILVRLEPTQAAAIKKFAKVEGVSEEELVRRWTLQHLTGLNGRAPRSRKPTRKS
jgi:CopG antitoxin of type II toxin-antitoxin system